nr:retrovirus-related Pol polyprotein from transposon TNT 1-94 [Tanacetum cinerariifolium]
VVDDYSWYTWVFFLHSKDEASEVIISFLNKTQVNLQLQVQRVRFDNGTEFKNKSLAKFFDEVGITQQFFFARTPQQNGVVERRNRTLVEAARTMLSFANLQSFLWAEAIALACFTQNRSITHKCFDKIPYELINKRKPNIKIFRVFGCRCYLLNDYKDIGKLKAKGDIGVFVGYSKESAAFRIYKKQTRKIYESVNVNFDEISEMASKQFILEPDLSNLNETGTSLNLSIIIDLEDEVVNLLEKEKANLETIESLKSKGFESSENVSSESENQTKNDCLVVEKECDKKKNSKVIAHGMFKLNVSQYVSPISISKSSCDSNNVEIKLKRKRRTRKSSKQNVKQVDNDVSRANNDFVHFLDLDTFSSVRRPRHRNVIWKKKESSNTSNVGLFAVSVSNLNKNVKRYSHKDFLACNNSHLGETSGAYMCNDAMKVSCDSRMNDLLDDNNFFIFDNVNVRISPVSKMTFRKKPCDSMHRVRTDNGMEFKNKTLAKYFDEVGINQQFSSARTPQQNGVVERRNRTLVEAARTMLTFANLPLLLWAEAIATTCFTQNCSIIHKHFDKTPYELINKRKPNIKFFRVFGCRCYLVNDYEDVRKLKAKGYIGVFVGYLKESAAFKIYNKRTRKIHERVNVNFDELSEMASKQFSLEPGLSNLNNTGKSSNLSVSQVEEALKKDLEDLFQDFYDEYFDSSRIMKPPINEEVFHEVSESFQGESSSSSLNDDVQQSPEEVILPSSNTQSILINVVPNGDEASTLQNVFNERLEDAYFNASTSFHDPSNVHTYYQPYPHEKK